MSFGSRLGAVANSGLGLVALATGFAGASGYLITWLVPRSIGFDRYTTFAAFWAFAFLLAAALSGVQQEITRATHPRRSVQGSVRQPWVFAAITSVTVGACVLLSSPAWVDSTFPEERYALVIPLAVGAVGYVWIAAITGTLYGLARWRDGFLIVTCEATLRLVGLVVALLVSGDTVLLAWAVVAPFGVTATALTVYRHRIIFDSGAMDVGSATLTGNVARTLLASTSMGMLISGFPLVVKVTSQAADATIVGLVVLTSTLVRAPLIVTAMALQSYLIVHFRGRRDRALLRLFGILGLVLALGAVLAVLGLWLGPAVFMLLFPAEPVPDGWYIAALIGSSALVACLCVTGPAVLARSAHSMYTAGWFVAAGVTIAILLLPLDLIPRVLISLVVAPCVGVVIHLAGLYRSSDSQRE